jgi:glutathione synthase/RimK-type ligase-like ATP-grasp enzyme
MVILNAGSGAWAFEPLAEHLSAALGVPVTDEPAAYFYLLAWDGPEPPAGVSFIPYPAIVQASDKRLLAETFRQAGVATPRTHLLETPAEVGRFVRREAATQWVLKYPTGCGGAGHRLLVSETPVPDDWPRPYIVQEFIRLEAPEVYRLYGAGGETFGWNVRRFPSGVTPSPWVAHARGARYRDPGPLPAAAEEQARAALAATGLLDSFGCADLLRAGDGRWLVLEVGTDGVFNHVDRDIDLPGLPEEIDRRLAAAFHAGTTTGK